MDEYKIVIKMFNNQKSKINDTIACLYISSKYHPPKNLIKNLGKKILNIKLLQIIQNTTPNFPMFTQAELTTYNGKNGNPAYIAINGVVYDVTNEATWAAATHFGLSAGKDLTNAFASCHAGQPILNKLKIVGKMADE